MSQEEKSCEIGPVCWCDQKSLRQLRAMLRRQLDADHSKPQETWDDYTTLVRKIIEKAVERAQESLKIETELVKLPSDCTFALSLVSGASQLWRDKEGNPLSGKRISYVTPTTENTEDLDKLQLSPVQVLYRIDRERRPLWIFIQKPPLDKNISFPSNYFWAEQKKSKNRSTVKTFVCLVKAIEWPNEETSKEASKVASALDQNNIYKVFLETDPKFEVLLEALYGAWQGFRFAEGQYLWIFGFDADREPSPYRTVVCATETKNAETCGQIRRWLNIFATILGEVAAVERSVSNFIASAKAGAFVVKSDPIRWQSLKRNQDTLDELEKLGSKVEGVNKKQAIKDLLGLLPRTRSVPAHRHTVLSMPEYRGAPNLRDVLLKTRALDTKSEVTRVFKGILEKLNETLYAVKLDPQTFNDQYIQNTYLQKYRERRSAILACCAQAIKNPSGLKTPEHLPIYCALESIYTEKQYVEVSCPSRTNFTATLDGSSLKKKWNSRQTKPVWDILCKLSSSTKRFSLRPMFYKAAAMTPAVRLNPPLLCLTHGDLHFGNILLDLGDLDDPVFKLIDAQIEIKGRDIVTDLSKMLQSCDALGDFIFEGLFQVKVWQDTLKSPWSIALKLGGGSVSWPISGGASGAEVIGYLEVDALQSNCFKWIREEFEKTVESTIKEDLLGEYWLQRAVFAEAMNLLTSPPFFLPENPEKALAFAASGAMVLTEWYEEFDGKSLIS